MVGLIIIVFFVLIILASAVKILQEYERGVVFRLGRLVGVKGPGLVIIVPFVDRLLHVSLRVITLDVPAQDVITKDNVSIKVNAVVYFRVMDAAKAIIEVQDYMYATSQIAQTTLRSVLGEIELDDLLGKREMINQRLQKIIDKATDPWGVKVSTVEVKHIDIAVEMQRAIARQAEAERERRAKIILAEAELQASEKLSEAAHIMQKEPVSIQLRYLQTLSEIATENNSTTLFPIPMDLFGPIIDAFKKKNAGS